MKKSQQGLKSVIAFSESTYIKKVRQILAFEKSAYMLMVAFTSRFQPFLHQKAKKPVSSCISGIMCPKEVYLKPNIMFNDENKASSLAKFLNGFDYVIVDTCSLMEDSFPSWMDTLVNAKDYLRDGLHIQILNKCVDELKKHSKNRDDDSVRIESKRALKILHQVKHSKILEFTKKERGQNFADNVIYTTVSNLRIRYRCLIITQDKGLASDLRDLNSLESQRGYQVAVYKLLPDSTLDINHGMPAGYVHQSYHAAPDRDGAKPQHHGLHGLFHHDRPQKQAKPAQKDPNDAFNKVLDNDRKLAANLANPNYPSASKLNDIDAQLKAIQMLPEDRKTALKLTYNDAKLHEEKTKLIQMKNAAKAAPAKAVPAAQTVVAKSVEAPKAAVNPVVKEAAETKPTVLLQKHLYYGEGHSIDYALRMCAEHYDLLFRDPSIPYVYPVHGPIDLTTKDQDQVIAALSSPKAEVTLKGILFKAEKNSFGYKVYIDLHPNAAPVQPKVEPKPVKPVEAKPVSKPVSKAPAKAPAPKAPAKPASKVEPDQLVLRPTTLSEPKPTVLKKEPVHRKTPAKKAVEPAPKAAGTGKGATLIVAVPEDEGKREFIERKSRRAAESNETIPTVRPNGNPRPAKKPVARPTKPAPAKPQKVASPKPAPKKVAKPVQPTKAPAKPQPKPVKPQMAKPVKSLLDEAKAAEKRLSANLHNPNYPKENKVRDLNAQIALVQKLNPADVKQLRYNADALKAMAKLAQ
jgi:rRNA-processing protein FCF1